MTQERLAHNAAERLVVDGMNVIGARPDGWWRDRDAAALRLIHRLQTFVAGTGCEVTVVLDGKQIAGLPEGKHEDVAVLYAARSGPDAADDRIVDVVQHDPRPDSLNVVTSDRELRERVQALGARVLPPTGLLRRLDELGDGEGKGASRT